MLLHRTFLRIYGDSFGTSDCIKMLRQSFEGLSSHSAIWSSQCLFKSRWTSRLIWATSLYHHTRSINTSYLLYILHFERVRLYTKRAFSVPKASASTSLNTLASWYSWVFIEVWLRSRSDSWLLKFSLKTSDGHSTGRTDTSMRNLR